MKVLILSNILEELNSKKQATLYGIQEKEKIIISSLKKKKGLKRIGKYFQKEKDISINSQEEFIVVSAEDSKLICFKNKTKIQIEIINYATDFNKRNRGIIDSSILHGKTLTIIGLGSVGSPVVIELLRSGITNFNLMDFDKVSISNLCRSEYDLFDIGKKKTEALYEKISRINPCANIKIYNENVVDMDFEKLIKIIQKSDLIIDATDSVHSKLLINGISHDAKPVIYPAVYDSGKGGDILFTKPGLPCYECVFQSIIDDMKNIEKTEWDYTTGQPKPMTGLIADIHVIVARTVKLALGILTSNSEQSFIDKITKNEHTLLLIGNEKNVFDGNESFQETWAETKIDPECSCQTLR